jgi:DNA-binding winged helix-turn-helix (wHTH) protein/TolB-like protein
LGLDLAEKSVYRLGDLEIDPVRGCLKRGHQEQYLRQQTFEVLLYLVEQRQRLVSKDELIEVVWRGTAVTDNALVQCIVEIRKVLGDDSRQPRFVKTIPKFGYRFIGSVEEHTANGSSAVKGEGPPPLDSALADAEASALSRARIPETSGVGPSSPPPERNQWLSGKLIATVVTVTLVLLTLLWLGWRHETDGQGSEVLLKQIPGKKSLAVLYFENQSSRPDLDWLSQGLADMLIADLSRLENLNVLGSEQLYTLWTSSGPIPEKKIRLGQALTIGRRSHAETLVVGSFAAVDQRVRIDVRLYGSRDNRLLGTEHVIADNAAQTLSQVDLLASKLAALLSGGGSLNSSLPEHEWRLGSL